MWDLKTVIKYCLDEKFQPQEIINRIYFSKDHVPLNKNITPIIQDKTSI